MTVASTSSRVSYDCDGSAYVFPFTFKVYVKTDLSVVLVDSAGAETVLTVDTQYEVAVSDPGPGGDVTILSEDVGGTDYLPGTSIPFPLSAGYQLVIYRSLSRTQLIDIDDGDRLPADTIEEGYDRAVMLIQELEEILGRTVKLKVSSAVSGISIADPDVGKVLAWNTAENGLVNVNLTEFDAAAVTDYWKLVLLEGNLEDSIVTMGGTAFGASLLDDGDAATARVTLGAKYDNVSATSRVLGRVTAGAGAIEELTITQVLDLIGSVVSGDILYRGSSTWSRLAKGSAYQALTMNSGATAPAWAASLQSLLTAAGDIIYASGANTPARLAKGAAGQVLRMNSGATAPEWAYGGKVVQVVNYETGAVATGTTVIPQDDTIPQKTEGDEYMTLAITPKSASNYLLIVAHASFSASIANTRSFCALFQDDTANAISASGQQSGGATNGLCHFTMIHYMAAGTTSATTFKVRLGLEAGTLTFNGQSVGRLFGAIPKSSITIFEIAA